MKNILDSLEWRYATKKFNPEKKLSSEQIDILLESLRLTPSSFGLQPWKFILVENPEIRETLVAHSWGQRQVSEASHLLVLCRKNQIDASLVNSYIDDMIEKTGAPAEALQWYKDMMLGFIQNLSPEIATSWAEKQVYIALWNIMTVAASLEIDTCPMEGFLKSEYDATLGLQELWLSSVVVLPLWYRSDDDSYATKTKIRYKKEDIVIKI